MKQAQPSTVMTRWASIANGVSRRLLADRDGVAALICAVAALPVLLLITLAIDFGGATAAKAKLDLAADAGVLTAAITASQMFAADPLAPLNPAAATAGVRRFQAQAGSLDGIALQPAQVSVNRDGATISASLTYNASYTTFLGSLAGMLQIPIGGSATAQITSGPYVDVQVLIDNSSSMTIAATPDDIAKMVQYSHQNDNGTSYASPSEWWSSGCSFACHWDPNDNDFYHASRVHNITLRLDQLKSAVSRLATTLNARNVLSQYRFGLYSFNTSLATVYPLSGNVAASFPSIDGVSPGVANPWAAYETNITQSLYSFAGNVLTQAGDGSKAEAPKKFVFILTDGVEDYYTHGTPSDRTESAMNPAACAAIKAKGAAVAVLHTVYYNPDGEYTDIGAIQDSVTRALKQCASGPELYFAVSDQDGINAAVQAMLNAAVATPSRLTF